LRLLDPPIERARKLRIVERHRRRGDRSEGNPGGGRPEQNPAE